MRFKIAYHLNHLRWKLIDLRDKLCLWAATDEKIGYPSEHIGTELGNNLYSISDGLNEIVSILIKRRTPCGK